MEHFWTLLADALAANGDATESRRLIHGRGRTIAGLHFINCDLFHPVLLISTYEPRDDDWWAALRCDARCMLNRTKLSAIVAQRRNEHAAPYDVLAGTLPEELWALSDGLRYQLSIGRRGRNVGFFLDMAPAHAWVRRHAQGLRVLNLFSYTCAFSVAALAGGAASVVNVDMNKGAIAIGQRNHAANELATRNTRFVPHDLFKSWGKVRRDGPYDLVIIDPPAYQFSSFVTARDYPKVLRRLASLAAPGARVLAALNSPDQSAQLLLDLFAESAPQFQMTERLPAAAGFADVDDDRRLKVLLMSARPTDPAAVDPASR